MTDLITFLQAQVEIKERQYRWLKNRHDLLPDNTLYAVVQSLKLEIESIKEQIEIEKKKI